VTCEVSTFRPLQVFKRHRSREARSLGAFPSAGAAAGHQRHRSREARSLGAFPSAGAAAGLQTSPQSRSSLPRGVSFCRCRIRSSNVTAVAKLAPQGRFLLPVPQQVIKRHRSREARSSGAFPSAGAAAGLQTSPQSRSSLLRGVSFCRCRSKQRGQVQNTNDRHLPSQSDDVGSTTRSTVRLH
jgi:transcription initiation factor TFIID subunit TAF12